jgi:hypothetical protein
MVYIPADGSQKTTLDVYSFKGKGVAMSMYNTDEVSIGHIRVIVLNTNVADLSPFDDSIY